MKRIYRYTGTLGIMALLLISFSARAQVWKPVTGEANLKALFTNTTMIWGSGEQGEYCPDGSGVIRAYASEFPRTWSIQGEDQVCISTDNSQVCYKVEQLENSPYHYRALDLSSGKSTLVEVWPGGCGVSSDSSLLPSPWERVSGEAELRQYFGNIVLDWGDGWSEFCPDGTGLTHAYNTVFQRSWSIEGEDQICIHSARESVCYGLEKHLLAPNQIRVRNLDTGKLSIFEIMNRNPPLCQD